MPPLQKLSKDRITPAARSPQEFKLPNDQHLLITTPSNISAWDKHGLHAIFTSSRSGIVAAREAKDGSGVLAVADRHVVVLHDTKRGQEKSWGLSGDDDQIRLIEYAPNAKSLFLTTSLTAEIQCYSPKQARLVDPAQSHASPPTVLAISPTGHLLLSASAKPALVYLKDLALNTAPTLILPRASDSPASIAAFHPERPNVFLLAFSDGVLATYDASRLVRRSSVGVSLIEERGNDGEIGHFNKLHQTTSKIDRKTAQPASTTSSSTTSNLTENVCGGSFITGAAFIPGYMVRVVTISSDGRCRLLDFDREAKLLRTWHARAPLTSVSVLAGNFQQWKGVEVLGPMQTRRHGGCKANTGTIGGPTSTNSVIAIGRADGRVLLFDSVGLLLAQQSVSNCGERIISLEWINGLSPNALSGSKEIATSEAIDVPSIPVRRNPPIPRAAAKGIQKPIPRKHSAQCKNCAPQRPALPPTLQPTTPVPSPTCFTIHPEEDLGTVRHIPSPIRDTAHGSMDSPAAAEYLDLFSPIRPPSLPQRAAPQIPVLSTPRLSSRPRISSRTFVQEAASKHMPRVGFSPTHKSHLLSDDSSSTSRSSNSLGLRSREGQLSPKPEMEAKTMRHSGTTRATSLKQSSKRVSFRHISSSSESMASSYTRVGHDGAGAQSNAKAKVLADLGRMSEAGPVKLKARKLSVFAPYLRRAQTTSALKTGRKDVQRESPQMIQKTNMKKTKDLHEREADWPEDSAYNSAENGDSEHFWITSGSEDESRTNLIGQDRRIQSARHQDRPPARQTSRSRLDSNAKTMPSLAFSRTSPSRCFPLDTQASAQDPPGAPMEANYSSSENEDMFTAQESPEPSWTPRSQDIRNFIPRTSPLSPSKRWNTSESVRQRKATRELILSATLGRQQRNPWVRARGGMTAKALGTQPVRHHKGATSQNFEDAHPDESVKTEAGVRRNGMSGDTCTRVDQLEDELARLKHEVLAIKAAMDRAGVSLTT